MKSAFMVQRPEKLFIHSDTGPPTGRWKDLFQLEGGQMMNMAEGPVNSGEFEFILNYTRDCI